MRAKLRFSLLVAAAVALPAAAQSLSNIAYGPDPQQQLDVYLPESPRNAPILFMVHGGAWMVGDKAHGRVVRSKTTHWLPKGYALVSVNYRISNNPNPLEQADDIARALAYVQSHATQWGLDANRTVLLGHSAGAHLVALLNADPQAAVQVGAKLWMGAIALDSAALDVVSIMESRHARVYNRVFRERSEWPLASPLHRLTANAQPMLLVCSTQRADSCPQANDFANAAQRKGIRTTVLPVNLSHAEINKDLGNESDYTRAVDQFLRELGLP
jgi:arylformamidase